jgi:uncharacterized protein
VVLSRDTDKVRRLLPMARNAFSWDPQSGPPPLEAFAGVDAVVNLLGESVGQKWTTETKKKIRDSRVNGTRNLVEALGQLKTKPRVFVSGSAVGYYGNRGEEEITEASAQGDDFLARVCGEWEAEAQRAETFGIRTVRLRTGIVLAREGGALQQMLFPFKLGLGGPIGSGKQWFPWIHRDDLVGLILHAISQDKVAGPLNGTSPNPVRQAEFAKVLGKVLGRPAFLPTPVFAMRFRFGEFVDAGLLAGQKVLPKVALDSGYSFKFPNLEIALREILRKQQVKA